MFEEHGTTQSQLVVTPRTFKFFKKIFIYLLLERRERRKRGRETSVCERHIDPLPLTRLHPGTWPTTKACALTRNQTNNLSVLRPVLNPLSHTSLGQTFNFFSERF